MRTCSECGNSISDDTQQWGRRILNISPEILVEFCKRHDAAHRTYTVDQAIPDDARVVTVRGRGNVIQVMLESAEWDDGWPSPPVLPPPTIMVHYLPDEEDGASENRP